MMGNVNRHGSDEEEDDDSERESEDEVESEKKSEEVEVDALGNFVTKKVEEEFDDSEVGEIYDKLGNLVVQD